MYNSFENKHYIVIGANSGIGLRLSQMLIQCNCRLLLVDKNTDVIEKLSTNSKNISYLKVDISNPERITGIFDFLRDNRDLSDGMIYCAGICPLLTLREFKYADAIDVYNINLISFISACRYFMDENYTNINSSIVAISSNAAICGGNRQYLYASSKAAMNLVVKSCAKELAERKIRINSIMPSTTNTEMVAKLRKESDAIDVNIKYKMPFGILQPSDVCDVVMFLLSDQSRGISGTAVKVNNGEAY